MSAANWYTCLVRYFPLIMPHSNERSAPSATVDSAKLERARRENAFGEKILDAAGHRRPMVMSIVGSIGGGNEDIARAEQNTTTKLVTRMASGNLILKSRCA